MLVCTLCMVVPSRRMLKACSRHGQSTMSEQLCLELTRALTSLMLSQLVWTDAICCVASYLYLSKLSMPLQRNLNTTGRFQVAHTQESVY